MFWKTKKKAKNGPIELDLYLSKIVAEEWEKTPFETDHWIQYMAVQRPHGGDGDVVDIRIFDEWLAATGKVTITDYESLDAHPELILFEGQYNEKAKKADLTCRKAA